MVSLTCSDSCPVGVFDKISMGHEFKQGEKMIMVLEPGTWDMDTGRFVRVRPDQLASWPNDLDYRQV